MFVDFLGAVHILRQPKSGVHGPPSVSNGRHLASPPQKNLVPKISTGVGAGRKFGYRTLMLMIISLARVWWPFGDTVQMKLDVTQRKTVLKILCSGQKMTRRHSERSWHISTNTRWQRLQKFNPPPLTTWLSAVGCCLVCLPLRQNRCKLEEVNRQLHQWSNWD